MKRCPKCNRQYKDDTLRFCLEDGTPLALTREGPAPATEILPRVPTTQRSAAAPTIPSYPGGDSLPTLPAEGRRSNPLLTGGVIVIALLLLVLVGIAGYFVFRQSKPAEPASSNQVAEKESASPGTRPSATPVDGERPATNDGQDKGPLKITASASSIRLAVQANTYYASNAIDGKRSTAWIEGVDGPGIGEWIRFDFDREINLHRILFQPGYFKSASIWSENNRLATVTAQFSDGSSRELNFTDQMESQKIDLGSVKTRWVKLVIKSVYYGTDPDTALSEVAFEWEP